MLIDFNKLIDAKFLSVSCNLAHNVNLIYLAFIFDLDNSKPLSFLKGKQLFLIKGLTLDCLAQRFLMILAVVALSASSRPGIPVIGPTKQPNQLDWAVSLSEEEEARI